MGREFSLPRAVAVPEFSIPRAVSENNAANFPVPVVVENATNKRRRSERFECLDGAV